MGAKEEVVLDSGNRIKGLDKVLIKLKQMEAENENRS